MEFNCVSGKSDMSNAATTIDFLANMEKSSQIPELDLNSTDPLPEQDDTMGSVRTMEENTNEASTRFVPCFTPSLFHTNNHQFIHFLLALF